MKNLTYWLCLSAFIFLPSLLFSQVAITYLNPNGFTVCDTASYQVTITNNAPDSIKGVSVTVDLPMGIDYVSGTVSNANESDISNLNAPIFGLPNLASGASQTFSLDGFYQCALISNINSGVLFTNNITVDYQGGNQTITTTPYDIETALLIITGSTNDNLTGTKGDVLTRTITVQNTRQGALSYFNFVDAHEGGIEITTDFGTVTNSSPTLFEMTLGPDDFMMIGDGDGLFELNETITITETILITTCGYDQNNSNSNITVNWGCGEDICQEDFSFAVIQFIPSNDNPVLTGVTSSQLPTNFCAEVPAIQSLTVTNTGSAPVVNSVVVITQDFLVETAGMHPNSFVIDSSGTTTSADPILTLPIDFEGCSLGGLVYQNAEINIPFLAPGESVIIRWDNYSCAQGCGSPVSSWLYTIRYPLSCPEDEIAVASGNNLGDTPLGDLMIDTVTFAIGEVILDNTTHTLDYGLGSDFLDDSIGILNLEFIIPCGFTWEPSNNLVLGGQSPSNFNIQTNPGNSIVTLEYDLPMNSDSVFTSFDLNFSCDPPCLPPAQYVENFNTSCPPIDICVGDTIYSDTMSVNTSIILDTTTIAFCAIQECQDFPLQYVCYNGLITEIYPPGYLDYQLESLRGNYGLADNNDDRIADANGNVNLNLVRRDRLIPGDTIRTVIDGAVLMDIPDSSFSLGTITVNIESHSADDNIDNGYWLSEGDLPLMAQGGVLPVDAILTIFDASSGNTYECPVNPAVVLYEQRAVATVPNTRPPEIIDEVVFTSYNYDISIASLQSCLPADYLYEAGDQVQFVARHQMFYNPLMDLDGLPMIVNMRTSSTVRLSNPGEAFFVCICPSVPWQYSPYRYRISPGSYGILPCETFDSPGGQRFSMLLGLGNFFPFEVRPLAYINEWNLTIPPQVTLLSSTLTNWTVQNGATLASNVPLVPDGQYSDDFEPYQDPLIDEGFFFSMEHVFDSDCYQEFSLPMDHHLSIDFADNLPEFPDPLDTLLEAFGSFSPLRPFLSIASVQSNFVSFDNLASWNFTLTNNPNGYPNPAENVWITINSPTGLLTDFQLINTTTGQVIMPQNGIYQLGEYAIGQLDDYQLIATTNSCDLEELQVNYGWNCDPYLSMSQTPCDTETFSFSVISPRGEIEMNIESPTDAVDLCDTIPYHTIEIFNAQIGAVFNVALEATLPQGLIIVPGSCQLAYPTSGAFIDIADPVDLGGGLVQWDISNINDLINSSGLSGISFSPDNSVSIRFLSATECGFIAGSQIVFTATAYQNCDEATNTLSRAGDPLNINGVSPPYVSEFFISSGGTTTVSCGDEFTMMVTMQSDGITLDSDSIFLTLPQGIFFDEDSYAPLSNASVGGPNITTEDDAQVLSWGILEGIPANSPISFEITLFGFSEAGCGENTVLIQSVQEQNAVCSATGELCSVFAQTGSSALTIIVDQPLLNITNFGGAYENGQFNFDINVNNGSTADGTGLNIDFYIDNDGDGILSTGDTYVTTSNYPGNINSGVITNINGNFDIGIESLCGLLAVIDEDNNCICNTDQSLLLSPLTNSLPEALACSATDVSVGITENVSSTYQWTPAVGLDCPTCPMTNINVENSTDDPISLNYTLIEDLGNCVINHELMINIQPAPGIIDDMPAMCPEGEVMISAEAGTSFNWSGEGIGDPNQQIQTVSPIATTTYSLTITDNNNCVGTDEIEVIVHPSPIANAGPDELYCEEDEVVLTATFHPLYFYEWGPANLLSNPNSPSPTITSNENTTFTLTVTDQNDCIAMDEVILTFDEGPDLSLSTDQEVICDGATTMIEVSGANTYQWTPSNSLNCATCPSVEASPNETTVYTVSGFNDNGCESTASVLVEVTTEPLMGEEIKYLCPGDSVLVFDEFVLEATTVCETLMANNGCDSLHCIQVIEADFPNLSLPIDLTVEAGMEVTIPLNPNYTYQWSPPGIVPACDNCSEVSFTLDETTTFSVTAINEEGCARSDSMMVRVFPMCSVDNVDFPNAFTPNGDGISDQFCTVIPEDHLEEIKSLKVFDRWGAVVYEGTGLNACWDGTYKGKILPTDVYFYIAVVGCSLRGDQKVHGDLTLIK